MIEFLGKQISNPLIASSCIATENKKNILNLAKNGVQGVILKSCADYVRRRVESKREFAVDKQGYVYASSPFEKEIMTLNEAVSLLRETRAETDILLIPSFTAASLEIKDWLFPCQRLAEEGADGIQLDFFYMGNIIGTQNFVQNITELMKTLAENIDVPVMPKLNINLPKDFIMPILVNAGIKYVSLLDSVRSPHIELNGSKYRLSSRLDNETTSCFGGWQLPLTVGYTYTAAKYGLNVCAGGGITCGDDVQKLLAAGASTVQSATFLTKYPSKAKYLIA